MTGNPAIDHLLECGPRAFDADVPASVRDEITGARALGWYNQALLGMAQNEVAEMHREIAFVSKQNREIENTQEFKACDGIGYPTDRIPVSVHLKMEDIYGIGCWKDPAFKEDFLKHHPGLRIKVTRGTRGQEYGGARLCQGYGVVRPVVKRQAKGATGG